MAEKLVKYYEYIEDKEGVFGKIRLAQLTLIPSARARTEVDTPELIERFKNAIEKITGEPAPNF
jgi:hypothetical protein